MDSYFAEFEDATARERAVAVLAAAGVRCQVFEMVGYVISVKGVSLTQLTALLSAETVVIVPDEQYSPKDNQ